MLNPEFAVAVFPFLKTSAPVEIGNYIFRSTTDLDGLSQTESKAVGEIAKMLFSHGNMRIKSASYTIVPGLEVHSPDPRLIELAHLRDVVAYLYSAPNSVWDNVFLSPEEASLALFTPQPVSVHLTRQDHNAEVVGTGVLESPDQWSNVHGYNGLYNFRHHFWVEAESRVYGPKPFMTLCISQDLYADLTQRLAGRPDYHLLPELLKKPITPASLRLFSALRWYNAANESGLEESEALLNLAVAFETLLRLPESSKSDRLIDAISLLLGRTERLDEWAGQFYDARSQVAHEGSLSDRYFYATDRKRKNVSAIFGSLMSYGRDVFQLCLSTLLVGMDVAVRADLQEKLVTNNERYQKLCDLLRVEGKTAGERLLSLIPTLAALRRYCFVASGVERGCMLESVRLSAEAIVSSGIDVPENVAGALRSIAESKRQDGDFRKLAAVKAVAEAFQPFEMATLPQEVRVVREIADLVWMSLFQQYRWLERQVLASEG